MFWPLTLIKVGPHMDPQKWAPHKKLLPDSILKLVYVNILESMDRRKNNCLFTPGRNANKKS